MPDLNIDCIARRGRNLVGFSGGPDSLCLLQMLADGAWRRSVVPVHIDHGLDAGSAGRAAAAQSLAEALGFDCEVVRVSVNPNHRNGPEAAARHARYAHFEAILKPGDHLLTAHHADDQVETVLLRLLRGAGPRGLAGMRPLRPLGLGWLGRPILHWSRNEVLRQLEGGSLKPVHDPGNFGLAPDRNYLRHRILPLLDQRWPGARRSVVKAAGWQADAAQALRFRAGRDLARLSEGINGGETLGLAGWLQLSEARALAALRQWCTNHKLEPPRLRMLEEFRRQCSTTRTDRLPRLDWKQASLLAWSHRIWLEVSPSQQGAWTVCWGPKNDLELPDGSVLRWRGVDRARLGTDWIVSNPVPGDRLQLHRNGPRRQLLDLLREHGIPPWRRSRVPCIRIDGSLRAIGATLLDPELAEAMLRSNSGLEWRSRSGALLSSSHVSRTGEPQ